MATLGTLWPLMFLVTALFVISAVNVSFIIHEIITRCCCKPARPLQFKLRYMHAILLYITYLHMSASFQHRHTNLLTTAAPVRSARAFLIDARKLLRHSPHSFRVGNCVINDVRVAACPYRYQQVAQLWQRDHASSGISRKRG